MVDGVKQVDYLYQYLSTSDPWTAASSRLTDIIQQIL